MESAGSDGPLSDAPGGRDESGAGEESEEHQAGALQVAVRKPETALRRASHGDIKSQMGFNSQEQPRTL